MSIIESYSYGTPIIGSRIGGIPEIVIEGKTGYQFVCGDSDDLQQKVKFADSLSAEDYSCLSAGTLKFAHDNLSLESYYPRLIAFYNQFLKK